MEDVIADLKHSLIDPQGDFVKLTSVDNDAKTVVISDKELGEIKHTPKQKTDIEELEKEINETDYDEPDEPVSRRERERERERERGKGTKKEETEKQRTDHYDPGTDLWRSPSCSPDHLHWPCSRAYWRQRQYRPAAGSTGYGSTGR